MLLFHGIKYQFGSPINFSVSYNLTSSLLMMLERYDQNSGNFEKTSDELSQRINAMYKSKDLLGVLKPDHRKKIAIHLRAKEMLSFISSHDQAEEILEIFRELSYPGEIGEKWNKIKQIMVAKFNLSSTTSPNQGSKDGWDTETCRRLLHAIVLIMMDQTAERPPANIILKFIPNSFPDHVWQTTDKSDTSNKVQWTPQDPHCSFEYLLSEFLAEYYQKALGQNVVLSDASESLPEEPDLSDAKFISMNILLPETEDSSPQLPIEDTMEESFLRFQRSMYKLYKETGLRVLAGMLYSLSRNSTQSRVSLNLPDLLRLIYGNRYSRGGEKRMIAFEQILDQMLNLKVVRKYTKENKIYSKITNLLNLETSVKYLGVEEYQHEGHVERYELVKDELLVRSSNNIKPLGYALKFLPEEFFQDQNKNGFFFEIGAYLSNCWFDEYEMNRGTTTKTPTEIINKGGLYVTKSGMYRAVNQIKRTLGYLKEKNYISYLYFNSDTSISAFDQKYTIAASEVTRKALARNFGGTQHNQIPL